MTLHFLRPVWLLGIIPCAYLLWSLLRTRGNTSAWRQACDPHLLPHLLAKPQHSNHTLPVLLLSLAWTLCVLALAGPTWSQTPAAVYRSLVSRMIVLDVSPSMLARDIKPSRMARAKYKAHDLLAAMGDGQVGMVAFSQQGFAVSPLTQDAATIDAMIPELNPGMMPVSGHNIGSGLLKAQQLLQQVGARSGQVILITSSTPTATDDNIAKQLAAYGYRVSVLGIGTQQGAPIPTANGFLQSRQGNIITSKLNPAALRKLARVGGGHYVRFSHNNSDVETLLQVQSGLTVQAQKTQEKLSTWRDQGRWLVLACLPLAALGFRRGWL